MSKQNTANDTLDSGKTNATKPADQVQNSFLVNNYVITIESLIPQEVYHVGWQDEVIGTVTKVQNEEWYTVRCGNKEVRLKPALDTQFLHINEFEEVLLQIESILHSQALWLTLNGPAST